MKVKKIKKLLGQVRDSQTNYDAKRALDEAIRVIETEDAKDNKEKKDKKNKKKNKKSKDKDKDMSITQMLNKMKSE